MIKSRWLLRALGLASLACLSGCQLLGGATSGIGQLLQLAIALAIIAAPIVLGYYLYTHKI